ncbi:MAG: hypothetical protein ACRDBZ_20650 [Citrobacter braakii]
MKELAGYWDVAAVTLAAHVASQKIASSETLKNVAATAQLTALQATNKATILGSAQATLQQAQAEQIATLAAVNETKSQIAKVEALRASALASMNAAEADLARAAVNKQLSILNAKLVADEARYAAALNATAAASGKASLAGRALAGIRSAASGVISLLGGPWMAAFTAGSVAVYALWSKMQQAEQEGQRLRDALKGVGEEVDSANEKADRLTETISQVALQKAREALEREEAALQAAVDRIGGNASEIITSIASTAERFFGYNKATLEAVEVLKKYRAGVLDVGDAYSQVLALQERFGKSESISNAMRMLETVIGGTKLVRNAQNDLTKAQQDYDKAAGKTQETITAQANKSTASLSKTKKELMSLADFTKKFRTELSAMQGVAGADFAKGLQDGLKSLRGELDKVKGATKEVRAAFEQEFTFAFSDKAIRDVKLEMMGLNSQFAELAAIEIDQKVAVYAAALEKASPAARAAAASTEQYKAALEKKVATDNLQDQVSFFKELADLSGDYGLSLEYQNKLIDIQAQRYKALFANEPQLQGFVDQWAALAKNALNAQTAIERAVNASWKKLEQGTGTGVDVMTAALGSVMDGYKNVAHSTAQIWGDFFSSFSKGAADSIGQAIVYGDDLGESLNNVAQQAIASLISAFMELAIQAAIVKPLMESLGLAMGDTTTGTGTDSAKDAEAIKEKTKAEIESIAEVSAARIAAMEAEAIAAEIVAGSIAAAMIPIAKATAAMWAEAAYLISVATEGGAATAGLTALQAGLAKIKATSGFDEGGYTGNAPTNQAVGVVHGQEYVLNAATTRSIGISNLDAINASGSLAAASLASLSTGRSSALSNLERQQSGGGMYVNVINNASDTTVSQQQSADANGNMRLDIIIDDIMAGKVVTGSTARSLQSAYGLRKTGFRV